MRKKLRFIGHCWRSKSELLSDLLILQPLYGQRPRVQPAKIVIDQLREDTGFTLSELPTVISDIKVWTKRIMDCRASST